MILYNDLNCCNCNGCVQACPKEAISVKTSKEGFCYPFIDNSRCVDCGLCQKVCAWQHIDETNEVRDCYVAVNNNKSQLLKSASGGIFSAVASEFLNRGGIVFGAALSVVDGKFDIRHIWVDDIVDLPKLQGSKYVQSNIGVSFIEVKNFLLEGKEVLFSGTPCQCAALKAFLRKDFRNLYLIDLICHGVPNQQFFNDYIKYEYPGKELRNFKFRDKSKGWELTGQLVLDSGKKISVPAGISSYYTLFLDAQTYRDNCYSCKYADYHRPGDITIGDYWGIEKQHPELVQQGGINARDGVSCIIVNTSKGADMVEAVKPGLSIYNSEYDKIAVRNAQLKHPMKRGVFRDDIFKIYAEQGYKGVDSFYKKNYKKTRIIHSILRFLPYSVKSFLRKHKP